MNMFHGVHGQTPVDSLTDEQHEALVDTFHGPLVEALVVDRGEDDENAKWASDVLASSTFAGCTVHEWLVKASKTLGVQTPSVSDY